MISRAVESVGLWRTCVDPVAGATWGRGGIASLFPTHIVEHVTEALLGFAFLGGALAGAWPCVSLLGFASHRLTSVRGVFASDLTRTCRQELSRSKRSMSSGLRRKPILPEGAPEEVVQKSGVDALRLVKGQEFDVVSRVGSGRGLTASERRCGSGDWVSARSTRPGCGHAPVFVDEECHRDALDVGQCEASPFGDGSDLGLDM